MVDRLRPRAESLADGKRGYFLLQVTEHQGAPRTKSCFCLLSPCSPRHFFPLRACCLSHCGPGACLLLGAHSLAWPVPLVVLSALASLTLGLSPPSACFQKPGVLSLTLFSQFTSLSSSVYTVASMWGAGAPGSGDPNRPLATNKIQRRRDEWW